MKFKKPSRKVQNLIVLWISPCFFFLECLHCCYVTYIFIAPTYRTTMIPLKPCELNVEFQHFVLSFFFLNLHFTNTIERGVKGWKKAQIEGEDKVNLWILLLLDFDFHPFCQDSTPLAIDLDLYIFEIP